MIVPTITVAKDLAKRQILDDIADGIVPASVSSFAELHQYVDANEYGDILDSVEDWNYMSYVVDAWLKDGRR